MGAMIRYLAAFLALALLLVSCGGGEESTTSVAPPKVLPSPIFDGLSLGMTRTKVSRTRSIRSSRTASGRSRSVWVYSKSGEYSVELTFADGGTAAELTRIDVHYGPRKETPDAFIDRFGRRLGEPDVRRRRAEINAYGDNRHDQYDTIWSDATQVVFLTERVPSGGRAGRTVYYLTVRERELAATGPPTGYVPPPPPLDENGQPIEDPIF